MNTLSGLGKFFSTGLSKLIEPLSFLSIEGQIMTGTVNGIVRKGKFLKNM